jgi:hypothetical protein
MNEKWIKPLFLIAALYDGVLGIAFIVAPNAIFAMYGVEPPNHMAYVQFPALLLIIFAIMFYRVAMDPVRNRELILYGCGLKVAYCSLAFWYEFTTGIPSMWIPWAWADLVFLLLFVASWSSLGRKSATATSG